MVGYGKKYPRRPHHRAASCPKDMSKVCDYSFALEKDDNPTDWDFIRQNFAFLVGCSIVCNNTALFYGMKTLSIVHWGAVVGGPDRHDGYKDDRLYYKQVSL